MCFVDFSFRISIMFFFFWWEIIEEFWKDVEEL